MTLPPPHQVIILESNSPGTSSIGADGSGDGPGLAATDPSPVRLERKLGHQQIAGRQLDEIQVEAESIAVY